VQRAYRQCERLLRRDLAAGDRLKQGYELRRTHDRIDRVLRHGSVTALSDQLDVESIRRRKKRAVTQTDLADVEPAVEVQRKGTVDVRVFKRAILDHQLIAGVSFFARLKAKDERAGYFGAPATKGARGGQEDCHMAVVTARVHHTLVARAIRDFADLLHGKRVHVGAQQRYWTGPLALQHRKNSGLSYACANCINAVRTQFAFDKSRGFELLERELRMLMKMPPVLNKHVALFGQLGQTYFRRRISNGPG